MAKAASFIRRVIAETVDDSKRPSFRAPVRVEEDGKNMAGSLRKVLENRESLKLTDKQAESARALVTEIEKEKEPDLKKLQEAMILLFTIVRSKGKP
jgi:hypothetical protein